MDSRERDPQELLDAMVDGALAAPEREALAARVAQDAGLEREARDLERLHALLAGGRIQARPGFAAAVMAALPDEPAWARQPVAGWRVAAAALVALLTVTCALLATAGSRLAGGSPALQTVRALADFATATALSGSGLLAASWRGVGMAVAAALTLPGQVVFGVGVVALNALLFVLLRRPRHRRVRVAALIRRGR